MTQINQLSSVDTLTAGDLIVTFTTANGDNRSASMTTVQQYMQANLAFGVSAYITQYSAPSATGFSVAINADTKDNHLILTPTATFATGTIVLPPAPIDKQSVLVNCTQIVTTLTVDGGTKTVTGAPTTLAANGFFTLKYDAVATVWYRVG